MMTEIVAPIDMYNQGIAKRPETVHRNVYHHDRFATKKKMKKNFEQNSFLLQFTQKNL